MSGRNGYAVVKSLLALSALLLLAGAAQAYVGPGAGLELVGYSMGLLVWLAVAFSAVLLYPFYSFVRWLRGRGKGKAAAAPMTVPTLPDGHGPGPAAAQTSAPPGSQAHGISPEGRGEGSHAIR